jgi:TIR domain
MARIFISYRRDDAGYVASMVRERLEKEFGDGSVFMDIDSVLLGVDFRQQLSEAVAKCDVLVALIGETWAGTTAQGQPRRIDNPQDFVRIEIEAALKRGIPVVPVLIDKAQLPDVQSLPESLRELSFRHAAELRAGRDLKAHLDTLSTGLRAHLGQQASAKLSADSAAHPASTPPADNPPASTNRASQSTTHNSAAEAVARPPSTQSSSRPSLGVLMGGAALILIAAGIWWFTSRPPAGVASPPKVTQAPVAAPAPQVTAPVLPAAPVDDDPGPASANAFQGYKIAIFYPAGDTAAGQTARTIRDLLAARGVQRGVELRLATAERLRQLIPPEGLEVRFDEGREDEQARLLVKLLGGKPLRRTALLKPVPSDEPTPNFISVFVPAGG